MSALAEREYYHTPQFQTQSLTAAVKVLLALNLLVFVAQIVVDRPPHYEFTRFFGLGYNVFATGRLWQIVTYMFLHGGVLHLLFNMLILFFLGSETERAIGTRHFVVLYFLAGILGGLGWLIASASGICIGASGAIFGVLGAFATLFPHRQITLLLFFVLPITMKAWVLAAVMTLVSLLYVIGHFEDGIAHSAHLAGVVAGYVYTYILFREGAARLRIPRRFRHAPRLRVLKREDAFSTDPSEVDRILDKIANEGMSRLTKQERDILERASRERRGGR